MDLPDIPEIRQLQQDVDSGKITLEHIMAAAYLGHQPARELLGAKAPATFSLQSMLLGGDRNWRKTMRFLGHKPAGFAACEIARVALEDYLAAPDSPPHVVSLAQDAVYALEAWKKDPQSELAKAGIYDKTASFCLAVDVSGKFRNETGFYGIQLGWVIGRCYSVVLAPENPRHVRWLGQAAEMTCRHFHVSEEDMCQLVAKVMIPFALGRVDRQDHTDARNHLT
jgi:hypothetical protein